MSHHNESLPGINNGPCGEIVRISYDRHSIFAQRCVLPHGHDGAHCPSRWQEVA